MNDPLILIVEDDARNRKLVRDVLQASGYRTEETDTAEEGIRLARELEPDLILMDIRLPGIDGVAAMGILQSDRRTVNIPVVAVTASVMPDDRERTMAAGFRAYKSKPVRVQELRALVREILGPAEHDTKGE